MIHFSPDTPWYVRLWYTYTILCAWWYYDNIYHPIAKMLVGLKYKWKYRKEHREMKKRYKKI